jgi:hypothetical protein
MGAGSTGIAISGGMDAWPCTRTLQKAVAIAKTQHNTRLLPPIRNRPQNQAVNADFSLTLRQGWGSCLRRQDGGIT